MRLANNRLTPNLDVPPQELNSTELVSLAMFKVTAGLPLNLFIYRRKTRFNRLGKGLGTRTPTDAFGERNATITPVPYMEEEVGFEPTEGCPSPPFQDGAIGLSAILPFLFVASNPGLFTTIRTFSLSIVTNSKWITLKNKPVHLSFPNPLPVAVFPFMSTLRTF